MKKITLSKFDDDVTSKELFQTALSNYAEGLKGVSNIRLSLKIFDKIDAASGVLELEDAEFDFLYRAVDTMQWMGGILKKPQFFEELEKAKIAK